MGDGGNQHGQGNEHRNHRLVPNLSSDDTEGQHICQHHRNDGGGYGGHKGITQGGLELGGGYHCAGIGLEQIRHHGNEGKNHHNHKECGQQDLRHHSSVAIKGICSAQHEITSHTLSTNPALSSDC